MKRTFGIVAIALIVGIISTNTSMASSEVKTGPTVTINGVNPMMGRANNIHLIDGVPVTISWSMANAPAGETVTEIWLLNSQGTVGYSLSGNGRNPVTGKLLWIPRTSASSNAWKIKVVWKTPSTATLVGTVIATAETPAFKIILKESRSICLKNWTSITALNGQALVQFSWTSCGLPAGAKIQLVLVCVSDPNAPAITIASVSDVGGYMWWLGDTVVPPGQYLVFAEYVNEYSWPDLQNASSGVPITIN